MVTKEGKGRKSEGKGKGKGKGKGGEGLDGNGRKWDDLMDMESSERPIYKG